MVERLKLPFHSMAPTLLYSPSVSGTFLEVGFHFKAVAMMVRIKSVTAQVRVDLLTRSVNERWRPLSREIGCLSADKDETGTDDEGWSCGHMGYSEEPHQNFPRTIDQYFFWCKNLGFCTNTCRCFMPERKLLSPRLLHNVTSPEKPVLCKLRNQSAQRRLPI